MSSNNAINRLLSQDKCKIQKVSVLCEFVKVFRTFGYVYTNVKCLNTSVVRYLHKRTS